MPKFIVFIFFLVFQLHTIVSSSPTDFIQSQCQLTLYPSLCIQCLSNHASAIQSNPKTLATTALAVALSRAQSLSRYISTLRPLNTPDIGAFKDCSDNMANAVDQLNRSTKEIATATAGGPNFRWRVGNVKSWVTAAVTFQNTCANGLSSVGGGVGGVRDRVVECTRVTSNSLALVHRWAAGNGP